MRNYSKHEEAKRLRAAGLTLKAIGAELGVSSQRVRVMLMEIEYRDKKLAWEAENPRPAPWHAGLSDETAEQLKWIGFNSRESCMVLTADELPMWRGKVAVNGRDIVLKLDTVNEVRTWLGVAPYVPVLRIASAAELKRAQRLLERHGWRVEPPDKTL